MQEFQKLLLGHGPPAFLTPRPPTSQMIQKVPRFQLHFNNKFPCKLFTDKEIKTEDGTPIRIVIKDVNSDEIVSSGPLSSLKIKIVVLDAEFCGDGREWTKDEFIGHIKSERKDKRPLLTGALDISLINGVGHLLNAKFTDNSSWTRSGFRLGAMECNNFSIDKRVREAISDTFKVNDCRVAMNRKEHPPQLNDEVWHLRKIGKNGVSQKKLWEVGIKTVQDFLRFYTVDPDSLHVLLGDKMPEKTWKTIVDHACGCNPGNRLYSYSIEEKEVVLVFNSIFQLVGAKIGGGLHRSLSCLTPSEKESVENLKSFAYKNYKDMDEFHGTLNVTPIFDSYTSNVDSIRSHLQDENCVSNNADSYDQLCSMSTVQVSQSDNIKLPVEPVNTNVHLATPLCSSTSTIPQPSSLAVPSFPYLLSPLQPQPVSRSNEHSGNQYKGISVGPVDTSFGLAMPLSTVQGSQSDSIKLPVEPVDTNVSLATPLYSSTSTVPQPSSLAVPSLPYPQSRLQPQLVSRSNKHSGNQYEDISVGPVDASFGLATPLSTVQARQSDSIKLLVEPVDTNVSLAMPLYSSTSTVPQPSSLPVSNLLYLQSPLQPQPVSRSSNEHSGNWYKGISVWPVDTSFGLATPPSSSTSTISQPSSLPVPYLPYLQSPLQSQPVSRSNEHSGNQYKGISVGPIDTSSGLATPLYFSTSTVPQRSLLLAPNLPYLQLPLQHQPVSRSNEHSGNQYKGISVGPVETNVSLDSLPMPNLPYLQSPLQPQLMSQSNEHSRNQYKGSKVEPVDANFGLAIPLTSSTSTVSQSSSLPVPYLPYLQSPLQPQPVPRSNEHSSNQYKGISVGPVDTSFGLATPLYSSSDGHAFLCAQQAVSHLTYPLDPPTGIDPGLDYLYSEFL